MFRWESVREIRASREEVRKGRDESMGVHPSLESICLNQRYFSKYFNALGDFSTRVREMNKAQEQLVGGRTNVSSEVEWSCSFWT